jgi:hypothetical protein
MANIMIKWDEDKIHGIAYDASSSYTTNGRRCGLREVAKVKKHRRRKSYYASMNGNIGLGATTVTDLKDFIWSKLCETVTVKSLMTGKDVEIMRSDVGGACDPSTERYHSM